MALILFNNNTVILNRVYWLFTTKFIFSSILRFKPFITRVIFITLLYTLNNIVIVTIGQIYSGTRYTIKLNYSYNNIIE